MNTYFRLHELTLIEKTRDWDAAVHFLEENDVNDLNAYLRMTFVMLDFLVDGQYAEDQESFVSQKIKYFFDRVNLKYSDNSEFMFFSGIMINIAEVYFGINDLDQAGYLLEKAKNSDPDNILYEWGYYAITDQRSGINTDLKLELSEKALNDSLVVNKLINLGLLGIYVSGILEGTYESIKAFKRL